MIPLENVIEGAIIVEKDPSDIAPLSAQATFATKIPVNVTLSVLGDLPVETQFGQMAISHRIPIVGLYPDRQNSVELKLTDTLGDYAVATLDITTEPLPDFFPTVDIVTRDVARMEPGFTLASLLIGDNGVFRSLPFMFDANGDVRWYMDLSDLGGNAYAVELLANGNFRTGYGPDILEYDIMGREKNRWPIPGYWYHHEVIEKPDGNLIVAVDKSGLDTVEDFIIEVDRGSGAVVNEWDLRQILDYNRRDFSVNENDWLHVNAVWYDDRDNTLIVSGRNQTCVFKVTFDNELVWILGPHLGWGNAGINGEGPDTREFLLTAVDAAGTPFPEAVQLGTETATGFEWPWGMHAPMLLPNGNILVFDNGFGRNFGAQGSPYSRGVEYEIDESSMTVRQVWEYGTARGPEFFSPIVSDVDLLPETGNRLLMPGIVLGETPHSIVTELSHPDGSVVFEAKVLFKNLRGTGELVPGQLDLVYRSERVALYPD